MSITQRFNNTAFQHNTQQLQENALNTFFFPHVILFSYILSHRFNPQQSWANVHNNFFWPHTQQFPTHIYHNVSIPPTAVRKCTNQNFHSTHIIFPHASSYHFNTLSTRRQTHTVILAHKSVFCSQVLIFLFASNEGATHTFFQYNTRANDLHIQHSKS